MSAEEEKGATFDAKTPRVRQLCLSLQKIHEQQFKKPLQKAKRINKHLQIIQSYLFPKGIPSSEYLKEIASERHILWKTPYHLAQK